MSFQSKTFLAILRALVTRMRSTTFAITDFTSGSVARMLLEAPAQEIDQLYQQMLFGLLEAIPVAIYTTFDFPPLPPTAASGLIRVILTPQNISITLPSGTLFTPAGGSPTYSSTTSVIILFGAGIVDIPVVASVVDVAGNLPAGTPFTVGISIPGFISASNLAPFTNGAPQETASGQKVRFQAYVQTLSRGTVASLIYAMTRLVLFTDGAGNVLEHVATAAIVEPWLTTPSISPGIILAYVHNGVGLTSPALVAQATAVISGYTAKSGAKVAGYKAIGTEFQAIAAAEQLLNVIGMLTIAPTDDVKAISAQATSKLYTYIQQIPVGQPYLPAVANDLVMAIDGVWNWMPVFPATFPVAPAANTKLMPGAFQVIGWLSAATVVQTATVGYLLTGGGTVTSPPATIDHGYIESLQWVNNTANPITYFSVTYTVPPVPASDDGQIVYLWGGISPTDVTTLLQPVLQWGAGISGGGPYWSLQTYWLQNNVSPTLAPIVPIPVSPGTVLQCVIICTGGTRGQNNFSYTAQFTGYPTTLISVSGSEELNFPIIGLEVYPNSQSGSPYLQSCSDYPNTDFTTMGSIVMNTGTPGTFGSPVSPVWQNPVNFTDCGQGITGSGSSYNFYYRNAPP